MPALSLRRTSIYSLPVILCLILSFFVFSSNIFGNADFDNALALYRQLEQEPFSEAKIVQYDRVIALLDKALAAEAYSSQIACEANYLKYECLLAQARYPEARGVYSNYLDRLKDAQGEDYACMVVRRKAESDYRDGDYTTAISYYSLLVEKYPTHENVPQARYWVGLSYQNEGDFDAAEAEFRLVIEQSGDARWIPPAYRKLAFNYCLQHKYDEAMVIYEQMMKAFAGTDYEPYAQFRKGIVCRAQRKYLEAVVEFQKVIDRYPASVYVKPAKEYKENLQEVLIWLLTAQE